MEIAIASKEESKIKKKVNQSESSLSLFISNLK